MSDYIEVTPLGGLGEFGMNCAALRCGDDMILIDAGIAFPRNDQGADLGVRIIVPDITFLKENSQSLRGIVLTHGHEDHIGAVSFIINELSAPVYGGDLTLGLVRSRLRERNLAESAQLVEIQARESFRFGCIEVTPLHVTHSFPESYCLAISTPVGTVIWTGDFKFDQTPPDGKLSDMHQLAALGEEGVLALFSDSTNSMNPGLAPSESLVYEPLRNLFQRAGGRIIASAFSSSINRIQILLDLAAEFDRKVAIAGRSMNSTTRIASELGYLSGLEDLTVPPAEAIHLPPEKLMIVAAGSQGEPMSALSRLAIDQYKNLSVSSGDIVILSTRIIPGNEKSIIRMVNHFYRRGAIVYDTHHSEVHVSGHGFQDDQKIMINLTRPRYFIPIHGEYQQLKTHAWLAEKQGISADRVLLIEDGDRLRLSRESAQVVGKISVGRRFIDDGILEEVHEMVLRERRFLSEDGFLVVILRMDRLTGELIGEPELVSRGFVLMEEEEDLVEQTQFEVKRVIAEASLEEKQDESLLNEILRKQLRRFLKKRTGKRPLILSETIEI